MCIFGNLYFLDLYFLDLYTPPFLIYVGIPFTSPFPLPPLPSGTHSAVNDPPTLSAFLANCFSDTCASRMAGLRSACSCVRNLLPSKNLDLIPSGSQQSTRPSPSWSEDRGGGTCSHLEIWGFCSSRENCVVKKWTILLLSFRETCYVTADRNIFAQGRG